MDRNGFYQEQQIRLPWYNSILFRLAASFCTITLLVSLVILLIRLYGLPLASIKGDITVARSDEFEQLSSLAEAREKLILHQVSLLRKNAETISNIILLHEAGQKSLQPKQRALRESLEQLRYSYQVGSIRLIDPVSSKVLLSLPADAETSGLSSDQLYTAARPGVDESIMLSVDSASKTTNLHIIKQIVDKGEGKDEKPRLIVDLSSSVESILTPWFDTRMQNTLGKTGETTLVDADGHFLAQPRFVLSDGSTAIPMSSKDASLPAQLALNGGQGAVEAGDYRNVAVLAAYRTIQLTPPDSMVTCRQERSQ